MRCAESLAGAEWVSEWGTSAVPAGHDRNKETAKDIGVLVPSENTAGTDAGRDVEAIAGIGVEALLRAKPTAEL